MKREKDRKKGRSSNERREGRKVKGKKDEFKHNTNRKCKQEEERSNITTEKRETATSKEKIIRKKGKK